MFVRSGEVNYHGATSYYFDVEIGLIMHFEVLDLTKHTHHRRYIDMTTKTTKALPTPTMANIHTLMSSGREGSGGLVTRLDAGEDERWRG